MFVLQAIGQALQMAFFMFWEVLWPLALGFLISAIVQSVVSKSAVVKVLGRADLRGVTFATLAGAASSSCSYAAVAVARGLFRKGGLGECAQALSSEAVHEDRHERWDPRLAQVTLGVGDELLDRLGGEDAAELVMEPFRFQPNPVLRDRIEMGCHS